MGEDDDKTLWVSVQVKNLKPHYCLRRLAHELIDEVGIDSPDDLEMRPTDEGLIDLPGMIMVDRSYQKIRIDTFRLVIPTEDFEYFHEKLVSSPLRKFKGGDSYYKLHGWMACVMLTRDQQEMLCDVMEEMLPEARHVAEKEAREFSRRMSEINRDKVRVVSGKDMRLKGNN